MNNNKREKDEYLERLWNMKEHGENAVSDIKHSMGGAFNPVMLDELADEGLVEMSRNGEKVKMTPSGEKEARKLIRAHRLAERLLHDVLGCDFEAGACEFEHIVNPELVDSICILLGHPRECPHGMPIPEGECCKRAVKTAESPVKQLTELGVGECGRIVYVNTKDDKTLHKMDGLNIRPGILIKVHQTYPCYVIECEGSSIALDQDIASTIRIWQDQHPAMFGQKECGKRRRGWFGFRRGRSGRGRCQ